MIQVQAFDGKVITSEKKIDTENDSFYYYEASPSFKELCSINDLPADLVSEGSWMLSSHSFLL